MCGRFALDSSKAAIEEFFDIQIPLEFKAQDEIFPSQNLLCLINYGNNKRWCYFSWGLIPHWAKTKQNASKCINARGETLNQKPSFKFAFKNRRCLIPASSYFEWKKEKDNSKIKYSISPNNQRLFAFAGIWEVWNNPETNNTIQSCSIVTTEANKLTKEIHHRMPLIVHKDHFSTWLTEDNKDFSYLIKPAEDLMIKARPF